MTSYTKKFMKLSEGTVETKFDILSDGKSRIIMSK